MGSIWGRKSVWERKLPDIRILSAATGSCDDGLNDGAYGSCSNDCLDFAEMCGDGILNGPEECDDENADNADGCLGSCNFAKSCLDILTYDDQSTTGPYMVKPDAWDMAPFPVHCDMEIDGGGYGYLKVQHNQAQFAVAAEAYCAQRGMQLFIPRSEAHKDASYAVAMNAGIGPDANQQYMRILGIYPEQNGATCTLQPLNSSNNNCNWEASDAANGGTFWIHDANNYGEPNGDNNVTGSMYYSWQANAQIQGFNDISGNGYSSTRHMCDFDDKNAP
jgi:cysteine-rich repeat protein